MPRRKRRGKKTGGRKKGTPNKHTVEFKALLETKVPDAWLVDLLKKHAQKDPRTAQYLADRRWGRMPQPLSTPEGEEGSPVVAVYVSGKGPPI